MLPSSSPHSSSPTQGIKSACLCLNKRNRKLNKKHSRYSAKNRKATIFKTRISKKYKISLNLSWVAGGSGWRKINLSQNTLIQLYEYYEPIYWMRIRLEWKLSCLIVYNYKLKAKAGMAVSMVMMMIEVGCCMREYFDYMVRKDYWRII